MIGMAYFWLLLNVVAALYNFIVCGHNPVNVVIGIFNVCVAVMLVNVIIASRR